MLLKLLNESVQSKVELIIDTVFHYSEHIILGNESNEKKFVGEQKKNAVQNVFFVSCSETRSKTLIKLKKKKENVSYLRK